MPDLYDRLENRVPQTRETTLFRDLRHILTVAKSRVPALRAQLKGIDIATLATRADLARVPLVRRRDLAVLQQESPPFGGTCATRASALRQIFVTPGGLAVPEGQAKDWWGMARALYAAGLRKGAMVLNGFAYHGGPNGHMVASGACALACPVIPVGEIAPAIAADVAHRLRPPFYCGTADALKRLLDYGSDAGIDLASITRALVVGPLSAGLRSEFALRGVTVTRAFVTPELGVVAFESANVEGMILNEGLILEMVDPDDGRVVEPGRPGEMVVTRLNPDFPVLRLATGATSSLMAHPSVCGRTNVRLFPPAEHAADSAEFCGTRIGSEQIAEIGRRHPTLGRLRLVVRRSKEQDVLVLRAEHRGDEGSLCETLSETLHKVTRMRGTVELVTPGSLRDDESVIVDERPLN